LLIIHAGINFEATHPHTRERYGSFGSSLSPSVRSASEKRPDPDSCVCVRSMGTSLASSKDVSVWELAIDIRRISIRNISEMVGTSCENGHQVTECYKADESKHSYHGIGSEGIRRNSKEECNASDQHC